MLRLPSIRRSAPSRKGHAVMEFALIAPWIFFVFVGVIDFGFYAYWLMAVTNASRVAAHLAAENGSSQSIACNEVRNELRGVLGWTSAPAACNASPLIVTVTELDSTTTPQSADASPSVLVSVTWDATPLIPVPGIAQTFTIRRDAEMRRK